jgi:predicted RNA-binding Zn-ribbon protein involved in translation (DUF1610 family)
MIKRHGAPAEDDLYARLAKPLPHESIAWRQDGKAMARDGKHFARFVAYVEANTVRERLDAVVPGEWDLTLELLPPKPDEDGAITDCSFKARLQILGVIREDVGTGKDYKSASTDAFKRAGVRFGIGHELYAYEQNWVQVDSDGKFPKPIEDPGVAYAKRHGGAVVGNGPRPTPVAATPKATPPSSAQTSGEDVAPSATTNGADHACPKCGGKMWDNRLTKRNPKAPDYKCRDRSCDGVIWPPKGAKGKQEISLGDMPELDGSDLGLHADDIPF